MNLYRITSDGYVKRTAYVVADDPTAAMLKLNTRLGQEHALSIDLGTIEFICDESICDDILVVEVRG